MSRLHKLFLAAVIGSTTLVACAQTPQVDHAQHHPQGAAAPAAAQPPGARAMNSAMSPEQMKAMHETHQKAMSAKTPEERQAAMAEHMKLMQGGAMPMMQMGGGAKGMQCGMGAMGGDAKGMACGMGDNAKGMQCGMMGNNALLEQRLAHMESMMQTMMERLPPAPAKKKH